MAHAGEIQVVYDEVCVCVNKKKNDTSAFITNGYKCTSTIDSQGLW